MKIVIERDGQSEELSGWRKWALAIPAILAIALVISIVIVVLLGVALTIGAILIVAIPAALVLALIARLLMRRRASTAPADPATNSIRRPSKEI